MMPNLKVGIVTVLYNSETVLSDFFATLNTQTFKNFILYVVDNKSPDNSLTEIKRLRKEVSFEVELIANDQNFGVAKGNNIGIFAALEDNCDLILLSNNDVVLADSTIELLLEGMFSMQASLAVPKIYYFGTDIIWAAGGRFKYFNGGTSHIGIMKQDKGQFDKRVFVKYSPTCFMLIRKEVFQKIGYMDEAYFVYYDDTDFVYRANKAGEKLAYIPESKLFHKESICTGGFVSDFSIRFIYRNMVYFAKKHYSLFHQFVIGIYNILHFIFIKRKEIERRQYKILFDAYKEGFSMYKNIKSNENKK